MNSFQSCRLSPEWNMNGGNQIIGLINLIFDTYTINPKPSTWVEIGTRFGESALLILSFPHIETLHCVDPYNKQFQDILNTRLQTPIKQNRVKFHFEKSTSFATTVLDNSIDGVYIDGDHSYESVSEDIAVWYPKIKSGGFLCGHDYNEKDWPGSFQAIKDFINKHNYEYKIYCDTSWLIRL